ncbi:MAG: hypothetical protein A3H57_04665 [Candidatus Taylorbacteria bacterium RIFCSPLOWO2_02_FULL_43_11]|uniref:Uncharacterized protein n=1 Tax=Candidatus Taylorbacteria bacterium RIFCSPHIGHO2_02_FULL_43_32b TaxID=1802306 RepID=A0A1G2MJN4_9BACT|nr:MAG: hypothetical protein A3C72_00075 [Candidatus Taylorbacteria bacterium RIFCSPHIGHO2_02_FULL_43_32b]OHA30024.1 MAG: hypothetical protein A3B08_00965 [Candidatus Taylorbacteria bacterium RIFCSPLOWO2_01_FULL_43_44]OHA35617.1 MAG: hypothetical protein A3H57_04665 [Candidatus Taylorbacteria bacterium RIFCSPLOWO2_02_FULL_43_11]
MRRKRTNRAGSIAREKKQYREAVWVWSPGRTLRKWVTEENVMYVILEDGTVMGWAEYLAIIAGN